MAISCRSTTIPRRARKLRSVRDMVSDADWSNDSTEIRGVLIEIRDDQRDMIRQAEESIENRAIEGQAVAIRRQKIALTIMVFLALIFCVL